MTAERRITITRDSADHTRVLAQFMEGWRMDPFFHQTGRPWTLENRHVWVLVKGTPEEIAELNPFVELPKPEADQQTIDKFAGIIDVVDVTPEAHEDGCVKTLTDKGYEVFNILKGSVLLIKRKKLDEVKEES